MRVAGRVAGALAVRLEHADGDEDLELADERDVVPLLLRRDARDVAAVGQELVLAAHDGRAVGDEAEEAGHGDAAVLDLGVAQPADGGLLALRPPVEGHRREVQRVEVVVRRAGQRLLERLEVAQGLLHDRRRRGRRRADERRGGRERERDDEGLRVFASVAAMACVKRSRRWRAIAAATAFSFRARLWSRSTRCELVRSAVHFAVREAPAVPLREQQQVATRRSGREALQKLQGSEEHGVRSAKPRRFESCKRHERGAHDRGAP